MALTRYPQGSVRELWSVSAPLMLSTLSLLFMVFCDRMFLAYYNADAMSASVTAGTAGWAILAFLLVLASMSEVLVAQYNGAGQFKRVGTPVWQAIWFSFASIIVLIPIGFWGGKLLFWGSPLAHLEEKYLFWMCTLGFSFPLQGAVSAFYVGRGKTKLVMVLAVLANVANIILDYFFIYTFDQGIRGAAIATCLGNLFQAIALVALFLQTKYRETYGTDRYLYNWAELKKILKVGFPQAFLMFIEVIGWAIFYLIISRIGPEAIFVAGVCQTVVICLTFAAEGIGRGAAAITGNMIGERNMQGPFRVFVAGLKLHVIIFAFMSIFLVAYPDLVIRVFLNEKVLAVQEWGGDAVIQDNMIAMTRLGFQFCLFYLLFEGIKWLASGILISAGDTPFLLIVGIITVPLCLIIPTYLFVIFWGYGLPSAFIIEVAFAVIVSAAFTARFFGKKWQTIDLISE